MKEPKMPELEKIAKVRDDSQAIGEFLDWLFHEKRIVLAQYPEENVCTDCGHPQSVHDERKAILTDDWEEKVVALDLSPGEKDKVRKQLMRAVGSMLTEPCCRECACKWYVHDERLIFADDHGNINRILAEYFEIDEKKAEKERMALLDYVRGQNRAK